MIVMETYEYVKNNKDLIRQRLIDYNLKRGETRFAKQIAKSINIVPNQTIKYDKNGLFVSKAEQENSVTRRRLLNPLAPIRKHNRRPRVKENKGQFEMVYTKEERQRALNNLNDSLSLERKAIMNSRNKIMNRSSSYGENRYNGLL